MNRTFSNYADSTDDDLENDEEKSVDEAKNFESRFLQGDFMYLFGHPEDFINKNSLKRLRSVPWASNVSHIVVDEAHCVVQWGDGFRPVYREIEVLRSVFPKALLLALTATASLRMEANIKSLLRMSACTTVIRSSSDRSNIKLCVRRRRPNSGSEHAVEKSYEEIINEYIEELRAKGDNFPKTVIFMKLKWCAHAHQLFLKASCSDTATARLGLESAAQFHAALIPEVRNVK